MVAYLRTPLGIFWDIENCPIPLTESASVVAKRLRGFLADIHRECGYAEEFCCTWDARRLPDPVSEGLNRNGVIVANGNFAAKNVADDRLQEMIDMFVDKFGAKSVLAVITGDINFAKPIRNARRKDVSVALIHGLNCWPDLKNLVNESYLWTMSRRRRVHYN